MSATLRMAEAIPIYPKQELPVEVARRAGVSRYGWLIDCLPAEAQICEDDDGRVSWLSAAEKRKWCGIIADVSRPGRVRAIVAHRDGIVREYPSAAKAAKSLGFDEATVRRYAHEGGSYKGWQFAYKEEQDEGRVAE